jgi:hypothetical protein
MVSSGRKGHGLIGYGVNMYHPFCCFACRDVLSASQLSCSEKEPQMPGMDMASDPYLTSAECFTTDDAFLQSLALCISERCANDTRGGSTLKEWQIEQWWQKNVAGTKSIQPDPKETYGQALAKVDPRPNEILVQGDPLNKTMLVGYVDYITDWNAISVFEDMETSHERFGYQPSLRLPNKMAS